MHVFTLTADQYAGLYALTFAGPGTGAIVNVGGARTVSNFVNVDIGSLRTRDVVFNFADATRFSMGGLNLRGTLLAPNAAVDLSGGTAFTGFAATAAVPEPATWVLMLAGFGAIGAVLRRRSKAPRFA